MATTPQTFPGFYATVVDKSFNPSNLSRFVAGITGVANKGPFNTPTPVNSLTEFGQKFGDSNVTATAGWAGQLAIAVSSISDFSGSSIVVRVGHQYTNVGATSSGVSSGATVIPVTNANQFTAGDYVRILKPGVEVTANAQIESVGASSITLTSALDYSYTSGAIVAKSTQSNAATPAFAFLTTFSFTTNEVGSDLSATISGTKGDFGFDVTSNLGGQEIASISATAGTVTVTTTNNHGFVTNDQVTITNVQSVLGNGDFDGKYKITKTGLKTFTYTAKTTFTDTGSYSGPTSGYMTVAALAQGDLIKISDGTNVDTSELLVKSVVPNNAGGCRVTVYPSTVTSYGYQSLPLQASYTAAKIYAVKFTYVSGALTYTTERVLQLFASSEGTWANSDPATNSALVVRVGPGSGAGTKKFMVYYDTQLVETLDNLVVDDTTSSRYLPTYINATSAYIRVGYDDQGTDLLLEGVAPSNTLDGWNITSLGGGKVNSANFDGGDNGANTEASDWIGELNPETDLYTGFSSLRNITDYVINIIACPGVIDTDSQQNLTLVASAINAIAVMDVDEGALPRQYADFRNAVGTYSSRVKIDDWHGSLFGNWFDVIDPYTGVTRRVPPSIGVLRCMARTFNNDKPWYASAGEIRGFIDNAQALQFRTINSSSKTQAYDSNVNLIVSNAGRIQVYGDRTLQVADSKLTELHVGILVNYIVANIGSAAKQFIFDPNDSILLSQLYQTFSQFLDGVQNERGLEQYKLVIDSSNNNAETRNLREVIVDLAIIPTSTAERIFLNLTVNRSGAQLNA